MPTDEGREAAWLAVPGRFPGDRTWATRAYLQLGRHLLKIGDRAMLDGLAGDLGRSAVADDRELARVLHAGASALAGDAGAVRDALDLAPSALKSWSPALLELAREVVRVTAGVGAGRPGVGGGPRAPCSTSTRRR